MLKDLIVEMPDFKPMACATWTLRIHIYTLVDGSLPNDKASQTAELSDGNEQEEVFVAVLHLYVDIDVL